MGGLRLTVMVWVCVAVFALPCRAADAVKMPGIPIFGEIKCGPSEGGVSWLTSSGGFPAPGGPPVILDSIAKLSPEGDINKISLRNVSDQDLPGEWTVADFAPGDHGEMYVLASQVTSSVATSRSSEGKAVEPQVVVLRFDGDGRLAGKIRPESGFVPIKIGVFPDGTMLMVGSLGDGRPKPALSAWLYASSGERLRRVDLRMDTPKALSAKRKAAQRAGGWASTMDGELLLRAGVIKRAGESSLVLYLPSRSLNPSGQNTALFVDSPGRARIVRLEAVKGSQLLYMAADKSTIAVQVGVSSARESNAFDKSMILTYGITDGTKQAQHEVFGRLLCFQAPDQLLLLRGGADGSHWIVRRTLDKGEEQ